MTTGPVPHDAYVMIIGAMKAGTTSLFRYLAEHPAVSPSVVKEPGFFSSHQRRGPAVERYEQLWEFDPGRHRVALEASTSYTKYPWEQGVPERIADAGLEPRFVYLLRDPFERIESHIGHHLRRRPLVAQWRERLRHGDVDEHFLDLSDYHLQLSRFVAVFGRERLLLLQFADLVREPDVVLDRVHRFLGLPPHRLDRYGVFNPRARKPASRLDAMLPERLRAPRYRLDDRQRAQVDRRLRASMFALAEEHGVDVSGWGFVDGS